MKLLPKRVKKVKPVDHKKFSTLRGKKRRRGKNVVKSKFEFHIAVLIWTSLTEKSTVLVPIVMSNGVYGMYKLRNKYSILDIATGTDIFQYPARLFKAHKKMHNKGYIQKLYDKIVSENIAPEDLLPVIEEHILVNSDIERQIDKQKAREKKANKKK